MRLSTAEVQSILSTIQKRDPLAQVYLYGSRVHDGMKGGDIDLWVLSERLDFSDKISILVELKESLGDQKIDLTVKNSAQSLADSFFQSLTSKVLLS